MSPHIHPLKTKVKKPKTKGTKADPAEKVTVAGLLPSLEKTDFKLDEQPYYQYFKRENITPFIDLNGKGGSPPLSIKMTLRLIKMVFLFVLLDIVCVEMVLKLQKAE